MTSKEKIEELHNLIDANADKLSMCDYLSIQHTIEDLKQDLKVLEILKKVFSKEVLEHEFTDAYECNKISKEEYKFLKNWLERKE